MWPWSLLQTATSKLRTFPREQQRFAVIGWLVAPAVEASLHIVGLKHTLHWVEATSTGPDAPPDGSSRAVTIERGEQLVAGLYRHHFLNGTCLPRALVQYWLHRRAGTPVRFVVGVRRQAETTVAAHQRETTTNGLAAHAWVGPPDAPTAAAPRNEFNELLTRGTSQSDHRHGPGGGDEGPP
jgi:hypothetical protein